MQRASATTKTKAQTKARRLSRNVLTSGGVDVEKLSNSMQEFYWYPVEFVEKVIGAKPDEWQKRVLRSFVVKDKMAIASCTGAGKTALAAWIILWFLICRPYSQIPCTAPGRDLLHAILWKELHKWIDTSKILSQLVEWSATFVRHRCSPQTWFAMAKTTTARYSEDGEGKQSEGIAGFHADHMLVVIDEASGVDTAHFDALEGTLTGFENKMLVIGNPLRAEGRFFEMFYNPKIAKHWTLFSVSALPGEGIGMLAERSSREHAKKLIEQYGEHSIIVQARVYGKFPIMQASDTAYSFAEITDAMRRKVTIKASDECQIGVDCARFGDDETVYCVRRGYKITRMLIQKKSSAVDIAGTITMLTDEEAARTCELLGVEKSEKNLFKHRPIVAIDEAGAGGGSAVCDILWPQGYANVMGVGFGEQSTDPDRFFNMAAEMWLRDLKDMMPQLQLPFDEELRRQLTTRKFQFTGKLQQRRLEPKDKMKRRGLRSPDRADALCLAVCRPSVPGVF